MPDTSTASPPPSLDPNAPTDPAPLLPQTNGSQTSDWGKSWVKDGAFDHAAFDSAPDDFKAYRKEFETFKDPLSLAKSYHELRSMASAKGSALLEPLPKNASNELKAERLNAIRMAVGAPDKVDGYVIEKPKDMPDHLWDANAVKAASEIAFKHAMTQDALRDLTAFETQRMQQAMAANETRTKEMWAGQEALAREAAAREGLTFDKAIDLAERAAKRYGGVDKANPIFQNATFLMMAARVGKAMGEDKLVLGNTDDQALRQHTPDTAQKALDSIRDDKTNPKWFAYWNRDPENPKREKPHPDHDEVVSEAKRLSALANANRKR